VSKLNPDGGSLAYSTFLGDGSVTVQGIAVDSSGHAFITGHNFSSSFPIVNPLPQTPGQ
jgi:hypothetical protein